MYKTSVCVPCLWYCSGFVCGEGAPSCAGPPVCAAGSFNTALGEQAEHLGPHFPLQKWMLKDDVTRVLPWLFLQVFSFVFVAITPPVPNLQCSFIIGLEHSLTWLYREYELRMLDTINIVVFPLFAFLGLWLRICFLWRNGKCALHKLLLNFSRLLRLTSQLSVGQTQRQCQIEC